MVLPSLSTACRVCCLLVGLATPPWTWPLGTQGAQMDAGREQGQHGIGSPGLWSRTTANSSSTQMAEALSCGWLELGTYSSDPRWGEGLETCLIAAPPQASLHQLPKELQGLPPRRGSGCGQPLHGWLVEHTRGARTPPRRRFLQRISQCWHGGICASTIHSPVPSNLSEALQ